MAEQLRQLHAAGLDGVQLTFYDYRPELEYFGRAILPLLTELGLRRPVPAAQPH